MIIKTDIDSSNLHTYSARVKNALKTDNWSQYREVIDFLRCVIWYGNEFCWPFEICDRGVPNVLLIYVNYVWNKKILVISMNRDKRRVYTDVSTILIMYGKPT